MNAVCMLLRPQLFDHPHWGISYFGSQPVTLLPYYGGLAIMIACLAGITRNLNNLAAAWRPLRGIFAAITVLTACIGLTSSMRGAFLFWAHMVCCFALLIVVMATGIWVLTRPGTHWYEYVWTGVLVAGTVLLVLSSNWSPKFEVFGLYAWSELILFVAALLIVGTAALRAVNANGSS